MLVRFNATRRDGTGQVTWVQCHEKGWDRTSLRIGSWVWRSRTDLLGSSSKHLVVSLCCLVWWLLKVLFSLIFKLPVYYLKLFFFFSPPSLSAWNYINWKIWEYSVGKELVKWCFQWVVCLSLDLCKAIIAISISWLLSSLGLQLFLCDDWRNEEPVSHSEFLPFLWFHP